MRRFVVVGHTQLTKPPLPLNDPAGAGGRWDLLARCVSNALLVSHGVRRDAEIVLVLPSDPVPRVIRVEGARVERLNPDERSTVALLSRALEVTTVAAYEEEASPGVWVSRQALAPLLKSMRDNGPLVWLDEGAERDIADFEVEPTTTFVLSDHRDLSTDESAILEELGATRLRLGPTVLQADQCVVVAHHWCDRASTAGVGGVLG